MIIANAVLIDGLHVSNIIYVSVVGMIEYFYPFHKHISFRMY